jgi:hypothetical protein
MRLLNRIAPSTQLFAGLMAVYVLFTLFLPASRATIQDYQLSTAQYHYLLLVVRLPIIAVWCIAYFSYYRLRQYAQKIKNTHEGDDFAAIAKGMGWIAWGLLISSFVSSILNAIANQHPSFKAAALIITNYSYVIVSLAAFTYIGNGAQGLFVRAKAWFTIHHVRAFVGVLVVIGVIFCVLISEQLHQPQNLGDSYNAFYMTNWLVWATIVIPYLSAWFIGFFAALELILVSRQTSGVIYRLALQLLAAGLVLITVSFSGLQYLRSVIPRSGHLTISSTLIATYAIYGVGAAGYSMLANGTKRLKRIEDI